MIAVPEGLPQDETVAYLRRAGIAERNSLSPEERAEKSAAACVRIAESEAFAAAEIGDEIAGLQRQVGGHAAERDAHPRCVRSAEDVETKLLAEAVHRVITF